MNELHVNDEPAFPYAPTGDGVNQPYPASGMMLRDWFAGQALAGLLASGEYSSEAGKEAYEVADIMLDARRKLK